VSVMLVLSMLSVLSAVLIIVMSGGASCKGERGRR
jgi:hypothetical protein